mmetsp:Transcript_409/g.1663  ORF Transcript_409/g.1663 Transcript_409/m.1663 type:complete len:239 (+) Transcript_409:78-794(+)
MKCRRFVSLVAAERGEHAVQPGPPAGRRVSTAGSAADPRPEPEPRRAGRTPGRLRRGLRRSQLPRPFQRARQPLLLPLPPAFRSVVAPRLTTAPGGEQAGALDVDVGRPPAQVRHLRLAPHVPRGELKVARRARADLRLRLILHGGSLALGDPLAVRGVHVALQVLLVALELVLVPKGSAERAGARAEDLIEDPERERSAVKHENHRKHRGEMPRAIRDAVHELTSERGLPVRVALPE